MFHEEFFPTPLEVAKRMWQKAGVYGLTVLDPSCGKGDLLADLNGNFYYEVKKKDGSQYGYWTKPKKLYGIELIQDLQEIARSKGIQILGTDFLTTDIDIRIDVIFMNPPFSNGDEHLLKAWDVVAPGGNVVCLLNAETVNNIYTQKRRQLLDIIKQYGTIEYWGPCFAKAERPTNVNVVCVHLIKPEDKERFEYTADGFTKEEADKIYSEELVTSGGLAKPDLLLALERAYNESKKAFVELLQAISKVESFTRTFSLVNYNKLDVIDVLKTHNRKEDQYDAFVDTLRRIGWRYIIDKTKLRETATSQLRADFDKFLNEQSDIAYTKENMMALIEMLFLNKSQYLKKAVTDVFNKLTAYDKENKIHWEGWKTNDSYKVNHKVIIPYVIEYEGKYETQRCWRLDYRCRSFLNDIDIALCFASGYDYNQMSDYDTLENSILRQMEKAGKTKNSEDTKGTSKFFEFKFHKKGTLHLWFRDEEVWMKFNLMAAAGNNWLPPDDLKAQERREREAIKAKKYADAVWVKVQKEQAKRDKLIEQTKIVFNPPNERGRQIISLLNKYGYVQSYHESVNLITFKKAEETYEFLDNTFELRVYDDNDDCLLLINLINEDAKVIPFSEVLNQIDASFKPLNTSPVIPEQKTQTTLF